MILLAGHSFLGFDASLTYLYVEEEYRNRKLAKAISLKLYHESVGRYGDDGFAHADVEFDKFASQAVAKGIGGLHMWTAHWFVVLFGIPVLSKICVLPVNFPTCFVGHGFSSQLYETSDILIMKE